MITSLQPDAVEAGAEVLRAGGNAVDAALACAFVQTVVDPMMCGIAGFGAMQVYMPESGTHEIIDFHGRVPAAATPEMWQDIILGETEDGFGFILKDAVNDLGYQSITTPGTCKAFAQACERYGTMAWGDLIEPAIRYARDGYVITPGVHGYWTAPDSPGRINVQDRLAYTAEGRRVYFNEDGSLRDLGTTIRNPGMASALERIAKGGSEIFYNGEMAAEIDADMKAHGGLLSARDLADYETETAEPMWGSYRGTRFSTNRPPGGGIMLIEMLNILENFDLAAMGHNSADYMRVVAEAMKIATTDKDNHVGDPRFYDVPFDRLTDKAYAKTHADAIERGEKAHVERLSATESHGTTHLVTSDSAGNIVTVTHTLGMMSGVITDGLGFMYNGAMGVFDPRPGRAGSLAPGKSRFSSLCPTIVFDGERPLLALGAPGGTQIAMGVLQVMLNVIDFGMTPQDAILAPRFSATSDTITVTARIPRYAYSELEADGYKVDRSAYSHAIASVHAIGFDADGNRSGGADIPYGGGMALAV
ncbi:MAG: gamma-glutamyltransferase [Rhodospirillaceae bacterium]|nr:gamma-glutamyltransferase [Rhodospirillaceae bacterium]